MNQHIKDGAMLVLFSLVVGILIAGMAAIAGATEGRAFGAEAPRGASLTQLQRSYVNILAGYPVKSKTGGTDMHFSAGSGSVIYSDGEHSLVLTCAHVVSFDHAQLAVYGEDDHDAFTEPMPATIEKIDRDLDLALLLIKGAAGKVLPLASVEPPRWSHVLAMGNGQGTGAWGAEGIVSGRVFTMNKHRYWRVQLPMIFGMSGGPVIDTNGRLVCVMSNILQHAVQLPDGSVLRTPATSFAMCVPLGTIKDFLADVKLTKS